LEAFQRAMVLGEALGQTSLVRDARKDLILAYAQSSTRRAKDAEKFFAPHAKAPGELTTILEHLAAFYHDRGDDAKARTLYHRLIAKHRKSYRIVAYQINILKGIDTLNDAEKHTLEMRRTVTLFAKVSTEAAFSKDRTKARLGSDRNTLEVLLRTHTHRYLADARRTRSATLQALSLEWCQAYLDLFETSGRSEVPMMAFLCAEILYQRAGIDAGADAQDAHYAAAAKRYAQALRLGLRPALRADAAFGEVSAHHKGLSLSSSRCPLPDVQLPALKRDLSPCASDFVRAVDRFVEQHPEDQRAPEALFESAALLARFAHGEDAVRRAETFVRLYPTHPLAQRAKAMINAR